MDLQSNLFRNRKEKKSAVASIASVVLHCLFGATVLIAGATATHHVAAEKPIKAFMVAGGAPPPPPPPPPPPAASSAPKSQPVHIETPKVTPQPTFVQPREIPKEVPKVEMPVPTTTAPVDPTPSAEPPSTGAADAGQPGGVIGGVAGGVQGGTVGGEVGGQIGGQVGGVVGGTLGGTVGGTGTGTGGTGSGEGNGTGDAKPEIPTGPVRVGGNVKPPIVVSRTQPDYTETARKARVAGVVVVEAIINKQGIVEQVHVVKGLPMGLSERAAEAVKAWRFKPGTMEGQPVEVIFDLTVNFKLD